MFGNNENFTKIKKEEFGDIEFIPFHQIKKKLGSEPYLKTISIKGYPAFTFFKFEGSVYILKPSKKNDLTKALCTKVTNPITINSAIPSITSNCAKGVQEDYINLIKELVNRGFNEVQIFKAIAKGKLE